MSASDMIMGLKLGMVASIDGVLPDLHYLLTDSGDVAQLHHFMQTYDSWLERSRAEAIDSGTGGGWMLAESQVLEFCRRAETQLNVLTTLRANAERHITPLVQGAIDGGR